MQAAGTNDVTVRVRLDGVAVSSRPALRCETLNLLALGGFMTPRGILNCLFPVDRMGSSTALRALYTMKAQNHVEA